jgi:hypothetical protein
MMANEAKREFEACTRLVGNLNQLHVLVRQLSMRLLSDPESRVEFTETWTCFLVEEVRENSGLTQGHSQQHWEGMPWQGCRHCMGRLLGEWEFEALEEAVSRMLVMVV